MRFLEFTKLLFIVPSILDLKHLVFLQTIYKSVTQDHQPFAIEPVVLKILTNFRLSAKFSPIAP
jgi:hypothetical protein